MSPNELACDPAGELRLGGLESGSALVQVGDDHFGDRHTEKAPGSLPDRRT